MWRSLLIGFIFFISTFWFPLSATASADLDHICTRTPGSSVTLRKGPGTSFAPGLIMVGSGGKKVDDFFRGNGYTIADGEQVRVSSSERDTDGQIWKKVGTNQWVAFVRGDFVCSATATKAPPLSAQD